MLSVSSMKIATVCVLFFAATARAATIPIGAEIQVRLTTALSSDKPSGQPVSGVVIVPVFVDGVPAIGTGTVVAGSVAEAQDFTAASDQTAEQPAKLRIEVNKIQDRDGHAKPLSCVLKAVDNARESVDSTGTIIGITASETFESRIDQGINKLESRYQQFADLLSSIKGALVKQVNASIDYRPGVEVILKLTKPLEWSASASANLINPITPAEALIDLVDTQQFRTIAQNPPTPSDMTNLMFIGTLEQLQTAFHEAGWVAAERLSESSKLETARAIIEDRGYSEAPMSILYLDGKVPDLTFQKQNDTFAMRHHIRIWQRPRTFQGKPVWVAAATHDVSIRFSPVSRSFTHGIDSNIDNERAKVVNDLLFTGFVHGLALVGRPSIPQDASNATGDRLMTDGQMAIVEF